MRSRTWLARNVLRFAVMVFAATASVFTFACAGSRFFVWEQDLAGRIDEVEDLTPPFIIVVDRDYEDEQQERLLAIAEATYPIHRKSIVVPPATRPRPKERARWWSSSFDGIKIPLAITKSAVDYYVGLVREFELGDFSQTPGVVQRSATLRYYSYIEPAESALESRKDLSDLFYVRMELSWSSSCGELCGVSFERVRILVVHKSGKVVELVEDPLQETSVS